jgi:large subunit ribosomal protein L29e
MAKSKNHTAHNQTRKNHRGGIKKPSTRRHMSMKGCDPKFQRNLKFAKKHNLNTHQKEKKAASA